MLKLSHKFRTDRPYTVRTVYESSEDLFTVFWQMLQKSPLKFRKMSAAQLHVAAGVACSLLCLAEVRMDSARPHVMRGIPKNRRDLPLRV